MSTTSELLSVLQDATEQVTGKELSSNEKNRLISLFNQGSGADMDRALNTIGKFAGLSRNDILNKAARSEKADQVMMELEETINNWRPGT